MSLFLQASPKQLRSCIQAAEICCVLPGQCHSISDLMYGRVKDRGAHGEEASSRVAEKKGDVTIEAEDCAALDELLGIVEALVTFEKLHQNSNLQRDGQYTRHL